MVPGNTVLDSGPSPPIEREIWGLEPQFAAMPPITPNYFGPCYYYYNAFSVGMYFAKRLTLQNISETMQDIGLQVNGYVINDVT